MDKLECILEMQKELDDKIAERKQYQEMTKEQTLERMVLALVKECNELHDELDWKPWKNPKKLNMERIKDELADILHFYASICIRLELNAKDVYMFYTTKNIENHRRQQGLSSKPGYCEKEV